MYYKLKEQLLSCLKVATNIINVDDLKWWCSSSYLYYKAIHSLPDSHFRLQCHVPVVTTSPWPRSTARSTEQSYTWCPASSPLLSRSLLPWLNSTSCQRYRGTRNVGLVFKTDLLLVLFVGFVKFLLLSICICVLGVLYSGHAAPLCLQPTWDDVLGARYLWGTALAEDTLCRGTGQDLGSEGSQALPGQVVYTVQILKRWHWQYLPSVLGQYAPSVGASWELIYQI